MKKKVLLMVAVLAGVAVMRGELEKERKECGKAVEGLATCLAYVQGSAGAPTPDCCAGLKGVLSRTPQCLCLLIKDRDDPSLGLRIVLSRALSLPLSCHASSNISRCPELLKLPPNSPDAQIFTNATAVPSGKGSSNIDEAGGSGSSNEHSSSNGHPQFEKTRFVNWLGMDHRSFLPLTLFVFIFTVHF